MIERGSQRGAAPEAVSDHHRVLDVERVAERHEVCAVLVDRAALPRAGAGAGSAAHEVEGGEPIPVSIEAFDQRSPGGVVVLEPVHEHEGRAGPARTASRPRPRRERCGAACRRTLAFDRRRLRWGEPEPPQRAQARTRPATSGCRSKTPTVSEMPSSAMSAPGFRRLLVSTAAVIFGVMGQAVARGWLAKDLTGSNTGLGGVMLAFGGSMLVATPWGGVAADRFSKRTVLLGRRGVAGVVVAVDRPRRGRGRDRVLDAARRRA